MANARIQFSISTEEQWNNVNPNLREGELVVVKKINGKYKLVVGAPGGSSYTNSTVVWDEASANEILSGAEAYKNAAAGSATNAANSANEASGYLTSAIGAASAAAGSATAAAGSATAAQTTADNLQATVSSMNARIEAAETAVTTEAGARAAADTTLTTELTSQKEQIAKIGIVGEVLAFAGATCPSGYLFCDGSELSKTEYDKLYAVIGDAYNTDSVTSGKFCLPNLVDKFIQGNATVGNVGGEATHKLTIAELPSHSHYTLNAVVYGNASGNGNYTPTATNWSATTSNMNIGRDATNSAGGDGNHNNLPPYVTMQYIIRYE